MIPFCWLLLFAAVRSSTAETFHKTHNGSTCGDQWANNPHAARCSKLIYYIQVVNITIWCGPPENKTSGDFGRRCEDGELKSICGPSSGDKCEFTVHMLPYSSLRRMFHRSRKREYNLYRSKLAVDMRPTSFEAESWRLSILRVTDQAAHFQDCGILALALTEKTYGKVDVKSANAPVMQDKIVKVNLPVPCSDAEIQDPEFHVRTVEIDTGIAVWGQRSLRIQVRVALMFAYRKYVDGKKLCPADIQKVECPLHCEVEPQLLECLPCPFNRAWTKLSYAAGTPVTQEFLRPEIPVYWQTSRCQRSNYYVGLLHIQQECDPTCKDPNTTACRPSDMRKVCSDSGLNEIEPCDFNVVFQTRASVRKFGFYNSPMLTRQLRLGNLAWHQKPMLLKVPQDRSVYTFDREMDFFYVRDDAGSAYESDCDRLVVSIWDRDCKEVLLGDTYEFYLKFHQPWFPNPRGATEPVWVENIMYPLEQTCLDQEGWPKPMYINLSLLFVPISSESLQGEPLCPKGTTGWYNCTTKRLNRQELISELATAVWAARGVRLNKICLKESGNSEKKCFEKVWRTGYEEQK